MTFFEIINAILEASRTGDVVTKYALISMLDDVEPIYADLLDSINYAS